MDPMPRFERIGHEIGCFGSLRGGWCQTAKEPFLTPSRVYVHPAKTLFARPSESTVCEDGTTVFSMDDLNRPLREVFDNIDAAELAAMRDRHEEESFNLDFKRMNPSGEPNDDDKRNLGKAISGYANSAGGIILWGVESKSGDDRRDRSRFQSIVPVQDGNRAVVRFHELTATATQPPVSGVIHNAIPFECGFVVKTFVPASDGGPHRTNEEKGQYFRRDADAFRAMQHHEIADMFGRRARPLLKLICNSSASRGGTIIALHNEGRGIARFPCLVLRPRNGHLSPAPSHLHSTNRYPMLSASRHPDDGRFEFVHNDDIIHPGMQLEVCLLPSVEEQVFHRIDYTIYSENMVPVEGTFRVWWKGSKLESPEERASSTP